MVIVEDLNIYFPYKGQQTQPVCNVAFSIQQEKLALVGESGSGKTLTAKALLGLVPPPGTVQAKVLSIFGNNILTANKEILRLIRGRQIAMITQDPKFSLNPIFSVGAQINECFQLHHAVTKKQAKNLTLEILREVNIKEPPQTYSLYPHQVSGGMAQRIMIAMMMACEPKLLIADEATSALDEDTQHEILELMDRLYKTKRMSILMISHDLPLVARYCDRALIMYQGHILETCQATELSKAKHPYTQGLWNCIPTPNKKHKPLPELVRKQEWIIQ